MHWDCTSCFLCIPFVGMGVYWYGCGYIPDCMGNLCSNGQVGPRQQRIQRWRRSQCRSWCKLKSKQLKWLCLRFSFRQRYAHAQFASHAAWFVRSRVAQYCYCLPLFSHPSGASLLWSLLFSTSFWRASEQLIPSVSVAVAFILQHNWPTHYVVRIIAVWCS